MYVIEITEDKYQHILENAEKMVRYGSKVMQCLEDLHETSRIGERRDHDDYPEYEDSRYGIGSRRRRY